MGTGAVGGLVGRYCCDSMEEGPDGLVEQARTASRVGKAKRAHRHTGGIPTGHSFDGARYPRGHG
jgi:hypothetical protein